MYNSPPKLIEQLCSFDGQIRKQALRILAEELPKNIPENENHNLHFHSFFSYNAEGWSPSRIAWEAKRAGLYAAGLCDFDVLDGLDEFLDACELLALRGTVNLETRAYLADYASAEINSPGEPGVTYIMGAGFVSTPKSGSPQAAGLAAYRRRAQERNIALVERINTGLAAIAIDYEQDVVPLSPGACPTERHIISAYVSQAEKSFPAENDLLGFWIGLLGDEQETVRKLLTDRPSLEDKARAKLAKRGGIGYHAPSPDTFPPLEEFITWVASCDALPMITWLDGTSGGEADPDAMLDCLTGKGCLALNIVPDRNWNIADAETKAVKVANLAAMVEAADKRHLPINIGTEMNKLGLPFVDDLNGEILSRHRQSFLRGAQIMVGHTILAKFADFPYGGSAAEAEFGNDKAAKNQFFATVGAMPPLTLEAADGLRESAPEKALDIIRDVVQ